MLDLTSRFFDVVLDSLGTACEDLPEGWVCSICGAGKDAFVEE